MIKSEVMSLDLTQSNLTPDKIAMIKDTLWKLNGNIQADIVVENNEEAERIAAEKKEKKAIKDKEIVALNSELKQEELNVEDLFGKEEK
jgi:hypothetical protein